jgi:Ca-activated chloride channel family protein
LNRIVLLGLAVVLLLSGCNSAGESHGPAPGAVAKELLADAGPMPAPRADLQAELREASETPSTEDYDSIEENPFLRAALAPLSTFSIDVDTAAWSLVRRHLSDGALPPRGAVRIEEMVNYFPYGYSGPGGMDPFAVHTEVASCPWQPRHRLVRIGLKGRIIDSGERPAANLVFLIDVSGSMESHDKLPLLVQSLKLLAAGLAAQDRVAVVAYAGASGLVLPSTAGSEREALIAALDRLSAGGSTNGGAGIRLAYDVARENFIKGGINRVILATDGDFNVGTTSQSDLVDLVQEKAKTGVFLTVLGFGRGNTKDSTMESLADKGNGNYAYIDSLMEGRKVLVEQAGGTLHTIAKDVKIQVEFNPSLVAGYRLIGYENRMLASEDFRDDTKDAGEIGAGHTVTALYEVVPAGVDVPTSEVDELKYSTPAASTGSGDLLTVKIRFKDPDGDVSRPLAFPLVDGGAKWADATEDFRFAAAVACLGMVLRGSKHRADASYDTVRELAQDAIGADPGGYRHEFISLVEKARALGAAREAAGTK